VKSKKTTVSEEDNDFPKSRRKGARFLFEGLSQVVSGERSLIFLKRLLN